MQPYLLTSAWFADNPVRTLLTAAEDTAPQDSPLLTTLQIIPADEQIRENLRRGLWALTHPASSHPYVPLPSPERPLPPQQSGDLTLLIL